jgi:hypothetical protein
LEFLEEKYFNIVYVNNNKDKDGTTYIPYSRDSDGNYSYKIFCEDKLYALYSKLFLITDIVYCHIYLDLK